MEAMKVVNMMFKIIPEPLMIKAVLWGTALPAATKVARAIEPTCKVVNFKIIPTAKAAMKGKAACARLIMWVIPVVTELTGQNCNN